MLSSMSVPTSRHNQVSCLKENQAIAEGQSTGHEPNHEMLSPLSILTSRNTQQDKLKAQNKASIEIYNF